MARCTGFEKGNIKPSGERLVKMIDSAKSQVNQLLQKPTSFAQLKEKLEEFAPQIGHAVA